MKEFFDKNLTFNETFNNFRFKFFKLIFTIHKNWVQLHSLKCMYTHSGVFRDDHIQKKAVNLDKNAIRMLPINGLLKTIQRLFSLAFSHFHKKEQRGTLLTTYDHKSPLFDIHNKRTITICQRVLAQIESCVHGAAHTMKKWRKQIISLFNNWTSTSMYIRNDGEKECVWNFHCDHHHW